MLPVFCAKSCIAPVFILSIYASGCVALRILSATKICVLFCANRLTITAFEFLYGVRFTTFCVKISSTKSCLLLPLPVMYMSFWLFLNAKKDTCASVSSFATSVTCWLAMFFSNMVAWLFFQSNDAKWSASGLNTKLFWFAC